MQAALAALATLGVTVTLDGDCGRTELAATSPAPYNSATKCTKLKNIDDLESICDAVVDSRKVRRAPARGRVSLQDEIAPLLRAGRVEFGAEPLLVTAPRRAPEAARVRRSQAQHRKWKKVHSSLGARNPTRYGTRSQHGRRVHTPGGKV